ncbi:hypothetical protein TCSYLVIO_003545 [Trypanosoma cruzi]|nr:hypothetical protein TCSYLVIO_003545 [Trypanosoma cruzi]
MESEAAGLLHTAALERHMQSIQQSAPAARINRAQCVLVASCLRKIFNILSRLPDPSPSLQLLTVFSSADMLVQEMSCEGWEQTLQSRFTCSDSFTGLFGRMRKAWRLHSTTTWEWEHKNAIREDELSNASKYVQLLRSGVLISIFRTAEEEEKGKKRGASVNEPEASEEQVICAFRRHQFGSWKMPFEELTPPDGSAHDELVKSGNAFLLFDVHSGYRYKGAAVRLHELEENNGRLISPETHTAFVQDMVVRATWSHPNIVPFIGAFTQKMSTHDGDTFVASVTPTPALGVIMRDVTGFTVQSVVNDNVKASVASYIVFPSGSRKDVATYVSLHELLFVQRRRFTLREALGITLQVAEALQYILVDETQVPSEVAAAWIVVSPSNIFLCPIPPTGETRMVAGPERGRSPSCWEQECAVENREMEEGHVRFVHMPATGAFAVMYAPPVYVEGSPFSRWQPHPHAANPVIYALIQLFIALISNEPPYRLLGRQKDLAARIFKAAETMDGEHDSTTLDDDAADALPFVKVSIPIGSVIPAGLPVEMRQLCERGLLLQHPSPESTRNGPTLEEFFGSMHSMWENAADVPVALTEQRCYEITGEGPGVSQSDEFHSSFEMVSFRTLLDDYGNLSQ